MDMVKMIFDWLQLLISGFGVFSLFLIFVALILILLLALQSKKEEKTEKIKITHLNKEYEKTKERILKDILPVEEQKKLAKKQKKKKKEEKPRLFVLDFEGDVAASAVVQLRDQITALIQIVRPEQDEVVLRLESPGGLVHAYGLAASQLARLRKRDIKLTIAVDKVAASGGYMMAVLGQKIICAPFAIIGSIGVVGNIPNLNRFLKKKDVDYYEFTAGEYKRTVTMLGEVTEKGKQKVLEQLEETHDLFKAHITAFRPHLAIAEVSTGEYWFGTRALELNLVDEIQTSDDYLLKMSETYNIYQLTTKKKETLRDKLSHIFKTTLSELRIEKVAEKNLNIPLV